jgi:hypothetical protein
MIQARRLSVSEGQYGLYHWRIAAGPEALEAKAAEWHQRWIKGIGYARSLLTR